MGILQDRDRGCASCRAISGGGLLGAGIYVYFQTRKFNKYTLPMQAFSFTLISLGFARIFMLPPFDGPSYVKNDEQL